MTNFSLPDDIAVVVVRVAALATLTHDDRKRAVAFALTREFGIPANTVNFAYASLAPNDPDAAIVAYGASTKANQLVDLSWVARVADGTVLWVRGDTRNEGNPTHSWLLSNRGAIPLNAKDVSDDDRHQVPPAFMALASDRARAAKALKIIMVGDPISGDAAAVEARLAHWSAALGASFERGELALAGGHARSLTALEPAPLARVDSGSAGLHRALNVALVASLVCVSLAVIRWASVPAAPAASASSPTRAGELWYRSTTAAPELKDHVRDATFAGSAWLIAAPNLPITSIDHVNGALRASALTAQIVREPELRLRVQAP